MTQFRGVPIYNENNQLDWAQKVTYTVNNNLNGKTNNTGTFTLAASTVSSTVTLASGRLGADTVIVFMPTTASAATEFGAGSIYVSSRDVLNNTFTVTHASTADSDKIFDFVLVG